MGSCAAATKGEALNRPQSLPYPDSPRKRALISQARATNTLGGTRSPGEKSHSTQVTRTKNPHPLWQKTVLMPKGMVAVKMTSMKSEHNVCTTTKQQPRGDRFVWRETLCGTEKNPETVRGHKTNQAPSKHRLAPPGPRAWEGIPEAIHNSCLGCLSLSSLHIRIMRQFGK